MFEDIEKAFKNNFNEVKISDQGFFIQVTFENLKDAEWFNENIGYPKDLKEDEQPIRISISDSPLMGENCESTISFKVRDEKKLIEMLNKHKND